MSYPSSIDSFSTKNTGDVINATDVNSAQTAIVALETKVGITGSAVTSTLDYKLTNTASNSPGHKHLVADITDAGSFIVTGLILPYAGSSAPSGYLLCDGSFVSRVTYATLFALVGTTFNTGDGSTTFGVPDLRSRSIQGVGTGTKVLTFVSRATNTITVSGSANSSSNEVQTGQAVVYTTTGGAITGLVTSTTYYLIRTTYNSFTLASSLANAIAGTAISLSSDGSGVQKFTSTLTVRALGDTGGEESHALVTAELSSHTHGPLAGQNFVMIDGTGSNNMGSSGQVTKNQATTGATGGNSAHNVINPFLALNYIIKT